MQESNFTDIFPIMFSVCAKAVINGEQKQKWILARFRFCFCLPLKTA